MIYFSLMLKTLLDLYGGCWFCFPDECKNTAIGFLVFNKNVDFFLYYAHVAAFYMRNANILYRGL